MLELDLWHLQMHPWMHTQVHSCTHTHTCTHTCVYIHACTHTPKLALVISFTFSCPLTYHLQ